MTDASVEPAWLQRARFYLMKRIHETPSKDTDNPDIAHFHRFTAAGVPDHPDDVSWCSSFVNCCLSESGHAGTRSKAARSWLAWGEEISAPRLGAVAVFVRGDNPAQGHVGLVLGVHGNGDLDILGGNQGNAVSIKRYPRWRLLSLRWPAGA